MRIPGKKSDIADGAGPVLRARARARLRTWLRAIHRDVGYSAVGLTFVYAASGLAVNHVASWDPNFTHKTETYELGAPLPDADEAASKQGLEKLRIREAPKEEYHEGNELEE